MTLTPQLINRIGLYVLGVALVAAVVVLVLTKDSGSGQIVSVLLALLGTIVQGAAAGASQAVHLTDTSQK